MVVYVWSARDLQSHLFSLQEKIRVNVLLSMPLHREVQSDQKKRCHQWDDDASNRDGKEVTELAGRRGGSQCSACVSARGVIVHVRWSLAEKTAVPSGSEVLVKK